jgi:threonine/homoserine/homoserine lactone efflux protein
MSWEFLLTAFVVCVAPGIGVIYSVSISLGRGLTAGLWAALGCTIVTGAHLLAAVAGLAAILHASAVLFQAIKFAGVAYLMWMAWTMLRGHGGLEIRAETRPMSPATIVWRGIVLNLLNPKLPLFFAAFLPQFIPAGTQGIGLLVQLGLAFVAMTWAVMTGYALFASAVRTRLLSSRRAMNWMRRVFAASFAALGLRLAFERA